MRAQLRKRWEEVRTSFWFLPVLMAIGASMLALAMVALDEAARFAFVAQLGWIYTGGPEGARALLSTVAGSVISVAGVTFSITIAALSLASSQFGPRLLRNFVRDTGNQIVLGTFIATFMYCLLVLRSVRGLEGSAFVPHLAVTIGVLLAIASMGVLIYFIHHVTMSIQVGHIITLVSHELDSAIDRLFPESLGNHATVAQRLRDEQRAIARSEHDAYLVTADASGYVQAVDADAMMHVAGKHNWTIRLRCRPGDFVVRGGVVAQVWPGTALDDERAAVIQSLVVLGAQRTDTQDVLFSVNQLVEIAVRALSPGINDPFTAVSCVDHLGAALCHVAERAMPSPYRYDDNGQLRVIARAVSFAELANASFSQIRQYSRSSVAVTTRLLETIAVVAAATGDGEHHAVLLRHAAMVVRGSEDGLPEENDRADVAVCYAEVMRVVAQHSGTADTT